MIRYLLILIVLSFLNSLAFAHVFANTAILISNQVNLIQDSSIHKLINDIDSSQKNDEINFSNQKSFTPLPIVTYDSDIGFGAGLKCFALNLLDSKESFDLILFGSTKGER